MELDQPAIVLLCSLLLKFTDLSRLNVEKVSFVPLHELDHVL